MKYTILIAASLAVLSPCSGQYRPGSVPSPGQQIKILKQEQDVNIDGSYHWSYETENGISAQEQGALKSGSPDPILEAQGSFQYTAPDGTPIQLQYISNEGGFQPQGAHLPVAPPIPAAILRALEWNAAHPEEDDAGAGGGRGGFRRN